MGLLRAGSAHRLATTHSILMTLVMLIGPRVVSPAHTTLDGINPQLVSAEYSVRGTVLLAALNIERQIKEDPTNHPYPFAQLIRAHIGNPQSLGQIPLR